jgi:hypothetical protein
LCCSRARRAIDARLLHSEDGRVTSFSIGGALALLAIVLVARAGAGELLARATGPHGEPRSERRGALAWCLALAWLAVAPLWIGTPLGSLVKGALVATALIAPLALLSYRRLGGIAWRFEARSRTVAVATFILFGLFAWVALTTFLWDEGSAHFGVPLAMARGALPAVLPLFPEEPFAYHLGYDVLVALVFAFTRLAPEHACDVVTLASAALLLSMLVHVGRALGAERGALLTPVLGVLGYGLFSMCLADGWGMGLSCSAWFESAWVSAQKLPPPVVSSFFQHPQGLGAPLMLAALLLALEGADRRRLALAFGLVVLMSQVQVVMAALTWGAVVCGAAVLAWQKRELHRGGSVVVLSALALLASRALGGLAGHAGAYLLFDRGAFEDTGLALLGHNLAVLGLCVVAAPLSLALSWRQPDASRALALRVGLAALVAVAFLVPNVMRYERSWDIVKFFAVGALIANVLLADAAAALWGRGALARVGAALIVALSVPPGALWLLRHGPLNGVVADRYTEAPPSELGRALDERFGDVIGSSRVLSSDPSIHQYGFLVVGHDWRRAEQGYAFDRARADELTAIAARARRALSLEDLAALRVRFVLFSARDRAAQSEEGQAVLAGLEHLGDLTMPRGTFGLYRVLTGGGA